MTQEIETFVTDTETMVDLIIWKRYRRRAPKLVEKTLELNPGLADLGPIVPRGTTIKIPLDRPTSRPSIQVIRLTD